MAKHNNYLMNYRFRVFLDNHEVAFSKVSGLHMEAETEVLPEGGSNCSGHIMRTPARGNRTLRMEGGIYRPVKNKMLSKLRPGMYMNTGIVIMILGNDGKARAKYCAEEAFVTKWEISELSAESGGVLVNVFEAAYTELKLMK